MDSKLGQVLSVLILCCLTIGTLSVTGLLQSTERIEASGIIIRPAKKDPTPPPPEPTIEIGVFSNPECTQVLSSVDWGEITAGEGSDVQIYVKNMGDTSIVLSLASENWSSVDAEYYMSLSWNYDGALIQSGQATAITLTLNVSEDCPELTGFGFDIVIIGS